MLYFGYFFTISYQSDEKNANMSHLFRFPRHLATPSTQRRKYSYHHHHHHHYQVVLIAWSSLNLSHHQSLSVIAPGRSPRLQLVSVQNWYKSLLTCQSAGVHNRTLLMSLTLLLQKCRYVLFVLLEWFVRCEAGGHAVAALLGIASTICSRLHRASLCSSSQPFSLCILLASMWCIYIVVRTKLWWNPVLFIRIDQAYSDFTFSRWDIAAKVCELVY